MYFTIFHYILVVPLQYLVGLFHCRLVYSKLIVLVECVALQLFSYVWAVCPIYFHMIKDDDLLPPKHKYGVQHEQINELNVTP